MRATYIGAFMVIPHVYSNAMNESKIDHELAEKLDAIGVDEESEGFAELAEDAIREAERQLHENHGHVTGPTKSVEDTLDPHNVRYFEIEKTDWQDPKVTIWLQECPHYANWAGTRKVVRTDQRGDLHYTLDIRPF